MIVVTLLNSSDVVSAVKLLSQQIVSLYKSVKLGSQISVLRSENLAMLLEGTLLTIESILIVVVLMVVISQVIDIVAGHVKITF